MAEQIVSPGVFQRETDQSFITPAPVEVGAAIIGPTVRGPIEQPTVVSSFADYKNKFGTTFVSASENLEFFTSIAAQKFFSNGGNSMLVTRVGSGSFTEATSTNIVANQGATSGFAGGNLSFTPTFFTTVGDEVQITVGSTEFRFIAAAPSSLPVDNSPVFFVATGSDSGSAIELLTAKVGTVNTLGAGISFFDDGLTLGISASVAGTSGNSITIETGSGGTISTDVLTLTGGTDGSGEVAFTLKTLAEGIVLNNSTGATDGGLQFSDGSLQSGSLDNLRYEITGLNTVAGTFNVSIRRGDDNLTNKIILETFVGCSLDPKADNYISKVIGDQYAESSTDEGQTSIRINGDYPNRSKFVRVSSVALQTPDYLLNNGTVGKNLSGNSFSANLPIAQSGSFHSATGTNIPAEEALNTFETITNITDGNTQGLKSSDYTTALNILKNQDEYRFATLTLPGIYQEDYSSAVAAAIELCEVRGDCFYIADMVAYNKTVADATAKAGELNTNFAGTYWPWVKVPSTELSRNVWAPASTVMQGVYAANDKVAAPWFAPAGLNRGGLPIVRTEFKVTQALRDKLYDNKVNPIATFPRVGPVAYGQKTLQKKKSALDRINVRRLLISLKNFIGDTSKNLVFEQNTTVTRNRFLNAVNPFLESVQQRQGLFAFRVAMDESNNTAEAIDRNQLVGQIFIQPTRTAEFIILDYTIQPTGATFND